MEVRAIRWQTLLLAVSDQVAYAAANLSVGLLLAYFGGMGSLGRYALIYSISAIAHSLFAGFVLDPMTTFAVGRRSGRARAYFGSLGARVGGVGLSLGVVGCAVATSLDSSSVYSAALGISLFSAQSMLLLQKRYFHVSGRVHLAALASILYAGIVLVLAIAAVVVGDMSESIAVAILAASALLSSLGFALRLAKVRCCKQRVRVVSSELTKYTFWSVATSGPATVAMQSIYWVATATSTVVIVGQLKLYEQLMMPVIQVLGSMMLLDHVKYSAWVQERKVMKALLTARKRQLQYGFITLVYCLLVISFAQFANQQGLLATPVALPSLAVYALAMVVFSMSMSNIVVLRAARAPERIALSYCVAAIVVLCSPVWSNSKSILGFALVVVVGWVSHLAVLMSATMTLRNGHKPI